MQISLSLGGGRQDMRSAFVQELPQHACKAHRHHRGVELQSDWSCMRDGACSDIQSRGGVQARRTCSTSSGGKQPSPYEKQALAAAMSWQHASLSNKNAEGSATSDEDHPRCVPSLLSILSLQPR